MTVSGSISQSSITVKKITRNRKSNQFVLLWKFETHYNQQDCCTLDIQNSDCVEKERKFSVNLDKRIVHVPKDKRYRIIQTSLLMADESCK